MANGKWQIFLIFVVEMRRLKKKIYYGACAVTFATLAVVRQCAHVLPDANPTEEEVVVEVEVITMEEHVEVEEDVVEEEQQVAGNLK